MKYLVHILLFWGLCASAQNTQVLLAWNAGEQQANWDEPTDTTLGAQFDQIHGWQIRGANGGLPVLTHISLAFLKPTEVLNRVNNAYVVDGVRIGMTTGVVEYYNNAGVEVFFSLGGITYTADWETAMATTASAQQLGMNAARIAHTYGVGIEIDYEESAAPNLVGLAAFIDAYRSYIHTDGQGTQYDPTGTKPYCLLTIDLGQGAQFMGKTADWVAKNGFVLPSPKLNWANAMVAGTSQSRISDYIKNWNQHVNGYSTLQTVPIPPGRIVGSVWSAGLRSVQPECNNFGASVLADASLMNMIKTAKACQGSPLPTGCKAALPVPPPGLPSTYTNGLLGIAYWDVGNINSGRKNTYPLNQVVTIYPRAVPPVTVVGSGVCTNGFNGAMTNYGITGTLPYRQV